MSSKSNKKCSGLMGRLFGHKYKAVYERDVEKISANEFKEMMASVSKHNFLSFGDNQIRPDPHASKRITEVYVCHCCERCGDIIKSEIKIS